jgi:putative tryptophan/tyrosine transport system substrate-binding protein
MKRRDFIAALGGATVWPLVSRAQPTGKVYRIGILETVSAALNAANIDALRSGLQKLGYVEGQNLIVEYRSAEGHAERFPDLASELVLLKVDVIVTRGTPAVQAAKNAAGATPVVMAAMGAPFLVVPSLSHPGGNVTGMTTFSEELIGKRIELLKELVPNLSRLALLHNIGNPMGPPEWEEVKTTAGSLALKTELFDVRHEEDLRSSFDALLIGADGLTQAYQQTIIDLAARHRLPASYPSRDFVENGGLMAYAVNYPDLYFRAASFVDKILRGVRAADLPVEQPTKFELSINLKTAKALGLDVPPTLLARADEVIE